MDIKHPADTLFQPRSRKPITDSLPPCEAEVWEPNRFAKGRWRSCERTATWSVLDSDGQTHRYCGSHIKKAQDWGKSPAESCDQE